MVNISKIAIAIETPRIIDFKLRILIFVQITKVNKDIKNNIKYFTKTIVLALAIKKASIAAGYKINGLICYFIVSFLFDQ